MVLGSASSKSRPNEEEKASHIYKGKEAYQTRQAY